MLCLLHADWVRQLYGSSFLVSISPKAMMQGFPLFPHTVSNKRKIVPSTYEREFLCDCDENEGIFCQPENVSVLNILILRGVPFLLSSQKLLGFLTLQIHLFIYFRGSSLTFLLNEEIMTFYSWSLLIFKFFPILSVVLHVFMASTHILNTLP